MSNSYEQFGTKTQAEQQRENNINNAVRRLVDLIPDKPIVPEKPITETNPEKMEIVRPGIDVTPPGIENIPPSKENFYNMTEVPPSQEAKSKRPEDFWSGEAQKIKELEERLAKVANFYDKTGAILNEIDSIEKLQKLEAGIQ